MDARKLWVWGVRGLGLAKYAASHPIWFSVESAGCAASTETNQIGDARDFRDSARTTPHVSPQPSHVVKWLRWEHVDGAGAC